MLSHSSICISLYIIETIEAISIFPSPQVRAYFRSFMGRNQFKKVRSRPLKKSEAEEVRQEKGVPFRRALHTFGTPCTLRCTPFFIEVCRRFFLFSLVYEPFPMLSRRPARHAHLFSNDLYTREGIYIFIYKTYKMVCIVCSTPKSPDKSRFKLHTMAKNGVQDSVHGVQGSVHERRNARAKPMPHPFCTSTHIQPPPAGRPSLHRANARCARALEYPSDRFRGVLRHEKSPRSTRVPQRA